MTIDIFIQSIRRRKLEKLKDHLVLYRQLIDDLRQLGYEIPDDLLASCQRELEQGHIDIKEFAYLLGMENMENLR